MDREKGNRRGKLLDREKGNRRGKSLDREKGNRRGKLLDREKGNRRGKSLDREKGNRRESHWTERRKIGGWGYSRFLPFVRNTERGGGGRKREREGEVGEFLEQKSRKWAMCRKMTRQKEQEH